MGRELRFRGVDVMTSIWSARALIDDWIGSRDSTYARLQAARYLSQASFGGNASSIDQVVELGQEGWFRQQLELPPTLHLTDVLAQFPAAGAADHPPQSPSARRNWML